MFCTKAILDLKGKNKSIIVRMSDLNGSPQMDLVAWLHLMINYAWLNPVHARSPFPDPPILRQTPACIFQLREGAHLRWVNPMTAEAVLPEKALNVCEDGAEFRCHVDLKMGEHYLGRATLTVVNEDRGQNQV